MCFRPIFRVIIVLCGFSFVGEFFLGFVVFRNGCGFGTWWDSLFLMLDFLQIQAKYFQSSKGRKDLKKKLTLLLTRKTTHWLIVDAYFTYFFPFQF